MRQFLSEEAVSGKKGHHFSQVKTPHNPLDSSALLMKKGMQREVPRAKNLTSLKKIILKERKERKQQCLQEKTVGPLNDDVQDVGNGGDDLALEQTSRASRGISVLHSCCRQQVRRVTGS